jgi:AcrR family transcriptional regulator
MWMPPVNGSTPRTRRAAQTQRTRLRIIEAAADLFADQGYATTTIEAIAARADVAVETIYSRFGSKRSLLASVMEPAITGNDDGIDLLDQPAIAHVRGETDQRTQLALLAHFSRGILQRTARAHKILRAAAASDTTAAELEASDRDRRYRVQTAYVDTLLANGPLRAGLTRDAAADTYASLANPATYAYLTEQRGWSPERFEEWLADSLTRLLLA